MHCVAWDRDQGCTPGDELPDVLTSLAQWKIVVIEDCGRPVCDVGIRQDDCSGVTLVLGRTTCGGEFKKELSRCGRSHSSKYSDQSVLVSIGVHDALDSENQWCNGETQESGNYYGRAPG